MSNSSHYTRILLPPVMLKRLLILCHQPQEEAGSAGGQPASNRADGDDCRSGLGVKYFKPFFNQSEPPMAKKLIGYGVFSITGHCCYPTTPF